MLYIREHENHVCEHATVQEFYRMSLTTRWVIEMGGKSFEELHNLLKQGGPGAARLSKYAQAMGIEVSQTQVNVSCSQT